MFLHNKGDQTQLIYARPLILKESSSINMTYFRNLKGCNFDRFTQNPLANTPQMNVPKCNVIAKF